MSNLDIVPVADPTGPNSRVRDVLGYIMYVVCFWAMVLLVVMMAPVPLAESVGRGWLMAFCLAALPLNRGLRLSWYIKLPLANLPVALLLLHAYVVYDMMQFKSGQSVATLWLVAGISAYAACAVIARWLAVHLVAPGFRVFGDEGV